MEVGRIRASRRGMPRAIVCMLVWTCFFCIETATALGGGGPENVFLVVNRESWASRTLANHYAAWRRVPGSNIFLLPWTDGFATVGIEQFRNDILGPVLKAIHDRGLTEQIDYIVYSSDFPYAVHLANDLQGVPGPNRFRQYGSINGLTYLADLVQARDTGYLQPTANHYMQRGGDTQAFRRSLGWSTKGRPAADSGRRYYLSTMLAVTSGRGNTVAEALSYLRRAVLADAAHPPGTIYFVRNNDDRSATRHGGYAAVVEQLRRLGVKAETLEGVTPKDKRDVQGAMLGSANLFWSASGSRILPGAICEHLTSYGGRMVDSSKKRGQTRLSELLRHGAAAASGTVSEPSADPAKFPTPMMHVHYARGSSLAEAFYQSVASPFQLLIVGDPLCRPWATIPLVSVSGVEAGATVAGRLNLQPSARLARGTRVDHYELFVDGRRRGRCQAGESLRLDTTKLSDGHHELRVVAIEASQVRSQGRLIVPIVVNNRGRTCRLTSAGGGEIRWGEPLRLSAVSPGSRQILIFHDWELVGRIDGAEGEITLDVRPLGLGPVRLFAVGRGAAGAVNQAVSAPLNLKVLPSRPWRDNPPTAGGPLVPGLQLRTKDAPRVTVRDTSSGTWLRDAGVKAGQSYHLSAYFDVASEGVYQLQARQNGDLEVAIDGHVVFSSKHETFLQRYIPFSLAKGTHRIDIRGRPVRGVQAQFRFGGFAPDSTALGKASQPLGSSSGFHHSK